MAKKSNVEFKEAENSSVQLIISISKDETKAVYDEQIMKYAKNIALPGFRKGKAPIAVLERKFGEALRQDIAGDLIDKKVGEVFDGEVDEKFRPLPYCVPVIEDEINFVPGEDFKFTVRYDVMPNITVTGLDKVEVEVPECSVGKEELENELMAIRERNSMVVEKKDDDKAEKGDIATVDYVELDDEGKEISGSARQDFVCTLGEDQTMFDFDNDFIGMKKGEEKEVTKTFPKDYKFSEYAEQTKKFRIKLTNIKIRNLPELDDELAQDVNSKYKTLDDLKKDISENLEHALSTRLDELKRNEIIKKLVELNEFSIPKSMVSAELESRWRMMAQQFQMSVEDLEKMFSARGGKGKAGVLAEWEKEAVEALKGGIITESLLKERKIEVSDEEIEAKFAEIAKGADVSVEDVKKEYANPRQKQYLIEDLREKKLFVQLLSEVKVKKGKKIPFSELFARR